MHAAFRGNLLISGDTFSKKVSFLSLLTLKSFFLNLGMHVVRLVVWCDKVRVLDAYIEAFEIEF